MLRRLMSRVRHLLRPGRSRAELEAEMEFHVERLAEDLEREGLDPKEARRRARMRFGSPERVHARVREERGLAIVDETARNVRLALRSMVRSPLFTTTFLLTLGLCIGVGTGAFSVVDAVLLRPLPYPAPERLANATLYTPAFGKSAGNVGVDGRAWERLREGAAPFERAVYSRAIAGVNLTTDRASAFARQQRVGAGYFGVLGVEPLMGREFEAAEDVPDGPAVVIVSHGLWSGALGGGDVLGETIRLKGEAHTVVGVMPADFRPLGGDVDVWTPLRASTTGEGGGTNYTVLVRIPEEMSFDEADARLAAVEAPAPTADDQARRRFGLVPLDAAQSAGARLPMLILMIGIGLMLVVGCANLAGLQIARALARAREMATRQALGSGTGSMVRQMVVENVMLGVIGGIAGLAIGYAGIDAVAGVVRSNFGVWQEVRLDGRTILAAIGITATATLLFGMAPVIQARSSRVGRLLAGGLRIVGDRGHRVRKLLLVGQVAMVTVLLFAAGLLTRSYGHLEGLDPGFDASGVLTARLSLDDARYAEADAVNRLFGESLDELRRIPGVTSAAVGLTLPYERALNNGFRLPGDDSFRLANFVYVTPGYFEVLGIPVLQGRALEETDRADAAPVVVVDEAWVELNLDGGTAVGSRITAGFFGEEGARIVGVVGSVQQAAGWGDNSRPVWETPTVYVPAEQLLAAGDFGVLHVWFAPSWIIRGGESQTSLASEVRQVFASVDAELPVARVASLEEVMSDAFSRQRFEAGLLVFVAAFSLLLAGVGLYGIVAHEVLERRAEMGLRMALGSTPGRAVWAVGSGGVRLTAAGLAVGGVLAVGVGRVMEGLIWGITPFDPATFGALVAVLGVLAAVASFVPAFRVSRMDPSRVLREA